MPPDTGAINDKAPAEASPAPTARFEVPEFLVPKSLAEVRELARLLALAEWAPDSYRDLEGNYVPQKIELAIMHGITVGLGPIAAMQSIAVIDGMPTIWGDGALSIVERSGLLEDMREEYQVDAEEGLTAVCTIWRRRRPTPIHNRFSMAMAEQARLTQKEGPWQSYPQRMLRMRARSWTIRDGFADVLRGLHIREEVDDFVETRGLSPAPTISAPDPLPIMLRPRRTPYPPKRSEPPAAKAPPVRKTGAPAAAVEVGAATEPGVGAPGSAEEPSAGTSQPTAVEGAEAAPRTAKTAQGSKLADAPDVAAETGVARESAGSEAGTAAADLPREESFTLANAEGEFVEVVGGAALRAEWQRIFAAKHLSPDQIRALWDANKAARAAIERLFGAEALEMAAERLRAAAAGTEEPAGRTMTRPRQSPAAPAKSNGSSPPDSTKPAPGQAGGAIKHQSIAGPALGLTIDPGWGEQKVLRHYRAALIAVHNRTSGQASEIARFREANAAVETRLRQKLAGRMVEIDAIYHLALRPE
jgi:hypothetical protein